jgi:DtxR family Mn-dependent transcriptional regulator
MQTFDKYLLAIDGLLKNNVVAKITDIAKAVGVKPSSVCEVLDRMSQQELVIYQKYKGVKLTKKGKEKLNQIKFRTNKVAEFLKQIDIPDKFAYKDAKALEAYLSPYSLKQITKFLDFLKLFGPRVCLFEYFKQYSSKGKFKSYYCKIKIKPTTTNKKG